MQEELLCMSVALIAGLMMNRLAKLVNLPAVTAYLVTGLLLRSEEHTSELQSQR